jgi:tetratricopeptide (TPR) repeat protein
MKSDKIMLPCTEVSSAIKMLKEKANSKKGTNSENRLLEYCLSFAEHQYGPRIANKSYRERNSVSVVVCYDNWEVDIDMLFNLCFDLGYAYRKSIGIPPLLINDLQRNCCMKAVHFYDKAKSILKPWLIQIDLYEDKRTDSINEVQMNDIYERTSSTERLLGECHMNLHNYDKAGICFDRAILYGKRIGREQTRTDYVYKTFLAKTESLHHQSILNLNCMSPQIVKGVYEDAYNWMAEAYNPYHPKVLEAANHLIKILIQTEEYYDAERYAIICYECLTRPVDTESDEVAFAAEALARINHELVARNKGGDHEKAEYLCRKSLRIWESLYEPDVFPIGIALDTLSDILILKENHDDEVKDLLERLLAAKGQFLHLCILVA